FVQAVPESLKASFAERIVRRSPSQPPHPVDLCWLLGVDWKAKRQEQSAKEAKRKEQSAKRTSLAELRLLTSDFCHLITLSARSRTSGGIVRPICFAVLRLITSSNFVGCSTGRSAGLAPFRIL